MNNKMGNSNVDTDWQTRCEKTRERLAHLWTTKLRADCKFTLFTEDDEPPVEVSAHKFVLAMSSPVFEAMFYGEMAEGDAPIEVTDVAPDAFKNLLEFLYTDEGSIRSYIEAIDLYYAARKYMIPYVQQRCVTHLLYTLCPQNACFAYEFAQLFVEKDLLQLALKTIRNKTLQVLKDTNYHDVHLSTMEAICAMPYLNIETEVCLFEAVVACAEAEGLTDTLRKPESDNGAKRPKVDEKGDAHIKEYEESNKQEAQIIEAARKAVRHIRFLTMSAADFATVALSALLEEEEAFAIMMNLAKVAFALPATVNQSTEKRVKAKEKELRPNVPEVLRQCEVLFQYNVYNFKTRKRPVKSSHFSTELVQWTVTVVPGYDDRTETYDEKVLGLDVRCYGPANAWDGEAWTVPAWVYVTLESPVRPLRYSFHRNFTQNSPEQRHSRVSSWSALCDSRAGYIQNNTLRIKVHVIASLQAQYIAPTQPANVTPPANNNAVQPVNNAVRPVNNAVQPVNNAVQTVNNAVQPVNNAVQLVNNTVQQVNNDVQPVNNAAQRAVNAVLPAPASTSTQQ